MPRRSISRLMIAGTHSGSGKTTITCALLKALKNKGLQVAAFKCGPDYIDPMFHSEIIGTKSRNIDFFLCGDQIAPYLFAKNSQEADISIMEGVMGFYDGAGFHTSAHSSWDVSQKLNVPVVLVVDAKGTALSLVAMVKGYLEFYPNHIKGIILNNVSPHSYLMYQEMLESHLPIQVLGYLPFMPEAVIGSRHLGLVTAGEIDLLQEKIEILAEKAGETIKLDLLLGIAKAAPPLKYLEQSVISQTPVNIALAWDQAFCFYYQDALDLLESLGARLIKFSPLTDEALPADLDGLILGGGYPELHLETLGSNQGLAQEIKNFGQQGLPIYAECGGFMYLGREIDGYPMVGLIDMTSQLTDRLQNFGYVTLSTKKETMLLSPGEEVQAHEFHYTKNDLNGGDLLAQTTRGRIWETGYCREKIFVHYPHIHFWGQVALAQRFLAACAAYRSLKKI